MAEVRVELLQRVPLFADFEPGELERLARAPRLLLERRRAKLEQAGGRLRALSPRSTLERGYAIVRAGDEIVRSPQAVQPGDPVDVEVAEGSFGARVEERT